MNKYSNSVLNTKRKFPHELYLFQEETMSNKQKFYFLMDLLVSNQENSIFEFYIFYGIFYLQTISSFFSDNLGIINKDNSFTDNILFHIQKILRIKDLFVNDYSTFKITLIIIFCIFILLIVHFLFSCLFISTKSFYSYNISFINIYIKIFLYIGYNIILDLCFSNFCFGFDEYNPNFINVKCPGKGDLETTMIIISIIFCIAVLSITMFILTYYYDSFFLSQSYYSKISCNYDYLLFISLFFNSIFLTQVKFLKRKIFLTYHIIMSIVLFVYFITHFLFYNDSASNFAGIFHILYIWSSVFGALFGYVNIKEKGIIYILIGIISCYLYLNIEKKVLDKILMDTPYHLINNQYYLLYYCHSIITKIICIDEDPKNKSLLSGIIEMHCVECPNDSCVLKNKDKLFLPLTGMWSHRKKKNTDDEIFLKNLILVTMNYFINTKKCLIDFYLNLSLYYLKMVGNYCEAIYNYKRASEFILSYQEEFSYNRLKFKISKALIEKLKPSNESVSSLEDLDVSQYYKYDFLSQSFINEIANDVNLSLEFWKIFRAPLKDCSKSINFNKVFKLTDEIRISKKKVEDMWNKLLSIYSGVNEYFELYSEYVVEMNDDDLKKRDLDSLKRKNDNYNDHINQNFYSILFNKDTGIIIANGDKCSEGIIELSNNVIERIFKYRPNDLKGKNLINLMPKLFVKDHSKYMQRYFKIGEKKIIDKNNFFSFGKDKYNNIIKTKLFVKLYPILNNSVLFVALIVKENIDDIILLDEKFNIQGMSSALIQKLEFNNQNIFQENEIPFYILCKKFVNFYSIFLQSNKKSSEDELIDSLKDKEENNNLKEENNEENKNEEEDKKEIIENIEINENIELEYEIKVPNFLIDFSEKTIPKNSRKTILIEEKQEENWNNNIINDDNEDNPLIDSKSKISASKLKSSILFNSQIIRTSVPNNQKKDGPNVSQTPTPTPTPISTPTPTPDQNPIQAPSKRKSSTLIDNFPNKKEKNKYNKIIKKYVKLFENSKFSELEDLIDYYNLNSTNEYKFNFTFDRYIYGNNQIAYIVRCIDNKNEVGKSEEESKNEFDPKGLRYKKEKIESIKPLYELFPSEKKELKEQTDNFIKLSMENYLLQKALQLCKDDIKEMSIAYGQKEDIIVKDENSSQIAQSGFDSGLVKKNRIEEIKSNLLVNIENFYILKYIKAIIILIVLLTIAFGLIYILIFLKLYQILKDVSKLNIELFQNCLWTTEIVSIFVSLKTLRENMFNEDFIFNFYKENKNEAYLDYFDRMKNFANIIYSDLLYANEALEKDISHYLNQNDLMKLYWEKINISYEKENYTKYNNKKDTESFPMAMAGLLSNCKSFLSNENFSITDEAKERYQNLSQKEKDETDRYLAHILHLIIENSYDNILPNHFKKINSIPEILIKYNENKRAPAIIILITYSCIMIILCILYYILVCLTNKSLTDGLNKVTKIRLEQVEETIKTIENFNNSLKSLRDKDFNNEEQKENADKALKKEEKTIDTKDEKSNDNKNSIVNNLGFNTDSKKIIPLSILNYSFSMIIYIICVILAFLIPIFLYSNQMVKSTNYLLFAEHYLFGNLIQSSIKTVEIKCFMSNCDYKYELNYSGISTEDLMIYIVKAMKSFSKVNDFYNKNFMLNACGAAIIKENNQEDYDKCLNDTLIISGNNTDSLIRLIGDIVDNIKLEYFTKINETNDNINKKEIKLSLFKSNHFQLMEKIFYKYILPVGNNFAEVVTSDLGEFLNTNRTVIIMLLMLLLVLIVIYCVFFGLTLIKKLIHYLSVSRCIMKIIPTSVIINTQELESWIENKYSF